MSPDPVAGLVELPSSDPDGTIHDIGYQHYSGPRLGRSYIRRALFVESARGAYGLGRSGRSKIMPMLLFAAMCLPALIIVVATAVTGADELVGSYPSYLLNLQLVIAIYVAGQAPASVSRDLRFGVMSLYFSRPLERIDYVLAKYGAMAAALLLLTATPLLIMFAGALAIGLPLSEQLPDLLRSLGGAALLSAILAGVSLAIASITPRRGMAVAAVIAVLLVLSGVQAVVQELAVEAGSDEVGGWLGLLSPFTLVEGVQAGLLGAASPLPAPPGTAGVVVFALAAVALIGGSFGALLLRYRRVTI